jgi:hypothetical protein
MKLQSVAFNPAISARHRSGIRDAMDLIDQIRGEMRRTEIFVAGARARKPEPKLDGERLGSSESVTFYDGYASTHLKFKNPYQAWR